MALNHFNGGVAFTPDPSATPAPPPVAGAPPPEGAPPAAPPPGAPPAAPPPIVATATNINVPGIGTATRQADGTLLVTSGPSAGLKLSANGQPDPQSLAQVQAAQKAQSLPGGLTSQGLTYSVNPDGTLTITGRTDGQPLPGTDAGGLNGAILSANGEYMKPDGTPVMAGNKPMWAPITPSGTPATDNPDFKGDGILTNGNNTGLLDTVPGFDDVKDTLNKIITSATTPGAIDTSGASADHDRAMSLADSLSNQANAAGTQADADRALGDQTRGQQEQSISDLQDAAAGKTASAAEIQGRNQASIDAARQYGLAAALQGNNPAAALRQASLGSAAVAGTNNANATALRATEQANARNALATTLGNVRGQDTANVNTDVGQQTNLNTASGTQSGQGVTSTGQEITGKTEEDKADAIKAGAIAGAGGTVLSTLLSDPKAKKDIKKTSLADALGKGVTGVSFSYKPGIEDDAPHFGVLADELEKVIPGVIKPGPMGLKVVDTGHMTMANTGILAELAKRVMALEKGKRK